jgi:hypothetical protein
VATESHIQTTYVTTLARPDSGCIGTRTRARWTLRAGPLSWMGLYSSGILILAIPSSAKVMAAMTRSNCHSERSSGSMWS